MRHGSDKADAPFRFVLGRLLFEAPAAGSIPHEDQHRVRWKGLQGGHEVDDHLRLSRPLPFMVIQRQTTSTQHDRRFLGQSETLPGLFPGGYPIPDLNGGGEKGESLRRYDGAEGVRTPGGIRGDLIKIGRASCRERGEISVVAGSLKKKKKKEQ